MTDFPLWIIAASVLCGLFLAGLPVVRFRWPKPQKATKEDRLDWEENHHREKQKPASP